MIKAHENDWCIFEFGIDIKLGVKEAPPLLAPDELWYVLPLPQDCQPD